MSDLSKTIRERLAELDERKRDWGKFFIGKQDENYGTSALHAPAKQLDSLRLSAVASDLTDQQITKACFNRQDVPCCQAICEKSGLRCHNAQKKVVRVLAHNMLKDHCVLDPQSPADLISVFTEPLPEGQREVHVCMAHYQTLINAEVANKYWTFAEYGTKAGSWFCLVSMIPQVLAAANAAPIVMAASGWTSAHELHPARLPSKAIDMTMDTAKAKYYKKWKSGKDTFHGTFPRGFVPY